MMEGMDRGWLVMMDMQPRMSFYEFSFFRGILMKRVSSVGFFGRVPWFFPSHNIP